MESLTALLNKLTLNKFDKGSEHWVYVTHINNPHNFYVRLLDYDSDLPALELKGESFDEREIYIQSEVVYKSKTIASYIRGQICYINSEQTFDIFAQDYGCIDRDVPLEYIWKPFYKHETPPLAVLCSLIYCMPANGAEWSKESIDAMKEYVKQERAKLIVQCITPNKLEVELINTCPDEIGTLLVKTGYASLGMAQQSISRVSVPSQSQYFYKFKELAIGDVLHVRHLRGKTANDFYVSQIDEYKEHIKRRSDLNGYVVYQKFLYMNDIRVGLPVAVQSNIDFFYERSIVTSIIHQKKSAEVYLVDCGISLTLSMSLIKPLNKDMFFLAPAIAIPCKVDENEFRHDHLNYLRPGYEFCIKIKAVGDTFKKPYIVEIMPITK